MTKLCRLLKIATINFSIFWQTVGKLFFKFENLLKFKFENNTKRHWRLSLNSCVGHRRPGASALLSWDDTMSICSATFFLFFIFLIFFQERILHPGYQLTGRPCCRLVFVYGAGLHQNSITIGLLDESNKSRRSC